jgi:hypothetical protein
MSSEQTRRTFFKSAAAAGLAYAIGGRHLSAQTATGQRPDADLILMNGRIATQDERRSFASAVAIKDGRFLAVGADQDVLAYRGARTQTIDAGGRTVIPGLNDSHTHPIPSDGRYAFETVVPAGYKVPEDGRCGQALTLLGRHPWRPAHIRFKLSARGYVPLTTMTYIEGAPYIDSNTTFSVKATVIRPERHTSRDALKARHRDQPFATAELDFALRPTGA